MKRILFVLFLVICLHYPVSVQANVFTDMHNSVVQKQQVRRDKKDIKNLLKLQDKLSAKYDFDGLKELYDKDFVSADKFDRETYFKLIKDTWKSYPDITYTTQIKRVDVNGSLASVTVEETSLATSTQIEDGITVFGELNSKSDGVYYLKKSGDKWLFSGEKVNNEKSYLKYGDTRFVDMDLTAPDKVKGGEYYTSSLTVDLPEDSVVIASIGKDSITYPQEKTDDVFRRLPEDKILERMFQANNEGKNEYNVASVGMSKSRVLPNGRMQVYLAGIAFIMTRVNIEAQNEEQAK